jgi:Protein kinase domain
VGDHAEAAQAADVLLAEGTRVGNFRIRRLLGEGAMGQVYLAQDTTLGRSVALKLIRRSVVASYGVEPFLEEARATASFNHPHIVTLYAVGEHEGRPYLALEYLDGESLRARLRRGPLPMPEALRYCRTVAEAIAEAHRRGFVHADLKPENIIMPRDGRLRVVDFGLAKLAGNALHAATGTPAYMAPERWRGAAPTGAIDVWALGVTLHESITGDRPIPDVAVMQGARVQEALELAGLPDEPWAQIVRDCLAFDPAARPSADELVRRFTAQLEQPRATTASARARTGRRDRKPTEPVKHQPATSWGGPWPLHPATGALLEVTTSACDAAEFRQEAALWLARNIGAEAVLITPLSGLAHDVGLVGMSSAWLDRLIDGFGRYALDFAQIVAGSRRWGGFTRGRDTVIKNWTARHRSAGFNEELVLPFGFVNGTAAVLEVRQAPIGAVMVGRERSSRRFTDGECDLLNGILPILAMGEAIHASAPAAPMAPAPAGHHGEATSGSAHSNTTAPSIADSPTRTARSASRFVPR